MSQYVEECNRKPMGLYHPSFEHDNCGIGAVVNIKGNKSHETVKHALEIVANLEHRAGKDGEGKTGDGVGILLQISHKFFKKISSQMGIELGNEREYGVGMFFFPQDELMRNQAKKMFETILDKEGLEFLGWREVPIAPDILGKRAVECMPCIMQCFVKKPKNVEKGLDFDRKLYIARRVFEQSNEDVFRKLFNRINTIDRQYGNGGTDNILAVFITSCVALYLKTNNVTVLLFNFNPDHISTT